MAQVTYVVAYIDFFEGVLKQKVMTYDANTEFHWKDLALHSGFLGKDTKETKTWLEFFPNEWDDKVCGTEFFNGECQFTWTKVC